MRKIKPVRFTYPLLKLTEAEVEIMSRFWLKRVKAKASDLNLVEEVVLYGAKANPDQCFRIIQNICRKTKKKRILIGVAINLLEPVVSFSGKKIKRKLWVEFNKNKSFKVALSSIFLTPKDKGFFAVKPLVKKFYYL